MKASSSGKQILTTSEAIASSLVFPANWSEQMRERLLAVKVADLCDGLHHLGLPVRLADSKLRPVVPCTRVAGPAITVRTFVGPGQRDYNEQAVRLYELGRYCHAPVMVLRCEVPGFTNMGGGGARIAAAHGYSGVVLEGPARDSDDLYDLRFPVFSSGICPDSILTSEAPKGTSIHFEYAQPVEIAGQVIRPGEIVVGDNDGLIVLSAEEIEPVLKEAEKVIKFEEELFRKVSRGLSSSELLKELSP